MGRKSVLLLLFLFWGCVKEDEISKSYEKAMEPIIAKKNAATTDFIIDGEREPEWPIDNDSTLLGVDSNKNNIRDDIEIYINHTEKISDIRKGLKQEARYYYISQISTLNNDKKNVWESNANIYKSGECLSYLMFAHGINQDLKHEVIDLYVNTKERSRLEKTRSFLLSGFSSESLNFHEQYKRCEFIFSVEVIEKHKERMK